MPVAQLMRWCHNEALSKVTPAGKPAGECCRLVGRVPQVAFLSSIGPRPHIYGIVAIAQQYLRACRWMFRSDQMSFRILAEATLSDCTRPYITSIPLKGGRVLASLPSRPFVSCPKAARNK
jgi:hypothetical protein